MTSDRRNDMHPAPEATAATRLASTPNRTANPGAPSDGSSEQLRAAFERATATADRLISAWPPRSSGSTPDDLRQVASGHTPTTITGLRALVRAAATAYARRLRDDGETPERMLVLVKAAASSHGSPRFASQELTSDIVRWSIEAYFDR